MTTRFFEWRMRVPLALALLTCLGAPSCARADGPIYLCIDQSGHKELTDINKNGCRRLDLPGTLIPAPARKWPAPMRANAPNAPAVAPSDFPRVDSAQQKARDGERRQILDEELRSEQGKLAELKREYNNGEPERHAGERQLAKYQERVTLMRENIGRAEKNVEALKREIANIR